MLSQDRLDCGFCAHYVEDDRLVLMGAMAEFDGVLVGL